MSKVRLQTTQNVTIDYDVARTGDRIIAGLLDICVLLGYAFAVGFVLELLGSSIEFDVGVPLFVFLLTLPYVFYHLLFESFWDGQSLGKKARKIQVVRADGKQANVGNYLLRWIVRFPFLIGLGVLIPSSFSLVLFVFSALFVGTFAGGIAILVSMLTRNNQRIGDLLAGTVVVRVNPWISLDETILSAVHSDYIPVYPQIEDLTEEDATLINDTLTAYKIALKKGSSFSPVARLREVLIRKYNLSRPQQSDLEFLQTILKDYNQLVGTLT